MPRPYYQHMWDLSVIDYLFLGCLGIGLLRGVFRGLSGELASIFGLVGALAAGWYFREPLAGYLAKSTSMTETQSGTLSILAILVAALLVFWALMIVLRSVMEFAFKGPLERVGGATIGVARAAIFLSILLILVAQFAPEGLRRAVLEESWVGQQAMPHLIPLYEDLVFRYPDLPPLPPLDEEYD